MSDSVNTPLEYVPANDDFKKAFNGKKIIETRFCTKLRYEWENSAPSEHMAEGGLTFILEDDDGNKTMVILGYTELGEWIEWEGPLPRELVFADKVCSICGWHVKCTRCQRCQNCQDGYSGDCCKIASDELDKIIKGINNER